jgi:hypothetical protein
MRLSRRPRTATTDTIMPPITITTGITHRGIDSRVNRLHIAETHVQMTGW